MRWHWAAGVTGAALWIGQFSLLAIPSGIRLASASADENRPASAAPQVPPEKAREKPVAKTAKEIRDEQLSISGRYARFERMLVQMADILGRQDPERADVIRRALGKSREDLLKDDIETVVQMLEQGQLGDAALKQGEVVKSFQDLLVLLQSEDRRSSVERERERLNGLLKNVRNLLNEQRSARAATQNSRIRPMQPPVSSGLSKVPKKRSMRSASMTSKRPPKVSRNSRERAGKERARKVKAVTTMMGKVRTAKAKTVRKRKVPKAARGKTRSRETKSPAVRASNLRAVRRAAGAKKVMTENPQVPANRESKVSLVSQQSPAVVKSPAVQNQRLVASSWSGLRSRWKKPSKHFANSSANRL